MNGKWYLIVIQNEEIIQALTYTSWNELLARFHQELAYRHESRHSTLCIILSSSGQELKRDIYIAEEL